jgi:hypothetical protein
MKSDYVIGIPSYKRSTTLKTKTLAVLEKYQVDPKKVTIFVADKHEQHDYRTVLADSPYGSNIVVGEVGIGAIRRHMQKWYPQGAYVVHMDDDLQQILRKVDDKKFEPIENFEEEVVKPGFEACEVNNAYLWGIYAAANPMFMNHRTSVGLYYIIGSLWGVINRWDEDLAVTLDDKEDFERTLQHYVRDGVVIRLDNITVKSNYYGEPGGMQVERTSERIHKSAEFLAQKYPDLCTMYIRKTTGHAELRLRDTRKTTEKPAEHSLESFF